MDKGEGVGGIDRELEEDAAGEVGKKAECSQAVEESPLKSPVRSKTNVNPRKMWWNQLSHKTFEDDDFDIVKEASFWNKGKALIKSKKTLEDDDFNNKAYEQFIESGRTVVGPFKMKEDPPNTLDPGYVLAKFQKFEVDRRCMASLRPFGEVEGSIIDCFSILMNKYERDSRLPDQPRQKTLGSFNVKRVAKEREWSTLFYEDNFKKCVKMFVPVLTLEGAPHWFGAELNMKSKVVSFLDSVHTAMDENYRVDATKEMLSTLDLLFDENKSKNVSFVDFRIDSKDRGLPQQDNDRDCGVYVMKYMEAVANEEEVVDQARLEIAVRIITDEQNEIHTKVVEDRRAVQGSSFASSSAPLRSPSKSPCDPQFSTAKSCHANMFLPSRASTRIRSSKAKISYDYTTQSHPQRSHSLSVDEMLTKASYGWIRLDGTTSNTAKCAIQLNLNLPQFTRPSWNEKCGQGLRMGGVGWMELLPKQPHLSSNRSSPCRCPQRHRGMSIVRFEGPNTGAPNPPTKSGRKPDS
ncbi:hypothetical protein F8388_020627 [Cannabis sativa]|uniref:Ubiquitin-like protease family profile domain-containing protein n=1 Tax=Cannabis sativa TaxID=3483 RepID=A0A7J6F2G9_CANSA|nr:hypothetical protein F8388_020627 [Cannabis sativa]